jgi:OOP family OmpA-OmpF porin
MLGFWACSAGPAGPEPAVAPSSVGGLSSSGANESIGVEGVEGDEGDEGSEEGLSAPVVEDPGVDGARESSGEAVERRDVGVDERLDAQRVAGTLQVRSNQLELGEPVLFETRQPKLQPASDRAMMVLAEYLHANPRIDALRIEVHTDSQGSSTYNQAMSAARALEVARRLVGDGVDCKRVVPVGFGELKPIADNRTAEGRAKNRRVVFVIASQDGRSTGGPLDGGGQAGDACLL